MMKKDLIWHYSENTCQILQYLSQENGDLCTKDYHTLIGDLILLWTVSMNTKYRMIWRYPIIQQMCLKICPSNWH